MLQNRWLSSFCFKIWNTLMFTGLDSRYKSTAIRHIFKNIQFVLYQIKALKYKTHTPFYAGGRVFFFFSIITVAQQLVTVAFLVDHVQQDCWYSISRFSTTRWSHNSCTNLLLSISISLAWFNAQIVSTTTWSTKYLYLGPFNLAS